MSLSLVAAAPSVGADQVATDACGDRLAENDVNSVPWQDLCSLAVTAVGEADAPTVLDVRLEVASVDRSTPSAFSIAWTNAEGCAVRLMYGDPTPEQDEISAVGLDCDDEDAPYDDCAHSTELPGDARLGPCRPSYDIVDIPAPSIDGTTYVWSITIDGAVAGLIGEMPVGTELTQRRTTSSTRTYRLAPAGEGIVCAGSPPSQTCYYTGDAMDGGAVITVE